MGSVLFSPSGSSRGIAPLSILPSINSLRRKVGVPSSIESGHQRIPLSSRNRDPDSRSPLNPLSPFESTIISCLSNHRLKPLPLPVRSWPPAQYAQARASSVAGAGSLSRQTRRMADSMSWTPCTFLFEIDKRCLRAWGVSRMAMAVSLDTHLGPDVPVVGGENAHSAARLIRRQLLDLLKRLDEVGSRSAFGVYLEVPIVAEDDNVVVLLGLVRERDIGGGCGHSDGVEPGVSWTERRGGGKWGLRGEWWVDESTYKYLYDAMHKGFPLTFSGSSRSLFVQPVPWSMGQAPRVPTHLSTSFLNSTVARTSSAALCAWFFPLPSPCL